MSKCTNCDKCAGKRVGIVLNADVSHLKLNFCFSSSELLILEEYNNSMQYEEQYINSVLEGMEASGQIICPVCHA